MAYTNKAVRSYGPIRGVDLRSPYGEAASDRSPMMVNMYREYSEGSHLRTRPGIAFCAGFGSLMDYDGDCGLIQYGDKVLVRVGQYLIWWKNFPEDIGQINTQTQTGATYSILISDLSPRSQAEPGDMDDSWYIIHNARLYVYDKARIYIYDGSTVEKYAGGASFLQQATDSGVTDLNGIEDCIAPLRYINCSADGSGTPYQPRNLLSPCGRIKFIADGESTAYKAPEGWKILKYQSGSSAPVSNDSSDTVTFSSAPSAGTVITCLCRYGTDEIEDAGEEYTESEKLASGMTVTKFFDNRVFRAGSTMPEHASTLIHSMPNDPLYFPDTAYYVDSEGYGAIKALMPTSSRLAVIKQDKDGYASVTIHSPQDTQNELMPRIYPSVSALCDAGCINGSCAVTFNDEPVFLSRRGLKGITMTSVTGERKLEHRSSLCDRLILEQETDSASVCVWNNYLAVNIGSQILLADGAGTFRNTDTSSTEYEWFSWPNIWVSDIDWEENALIYAETPLRLFAYRSDGEPDLLCFITEGGNVYRFDLEKGTDTSYNGQDELPIFCCVATPSEDFGYPHKVKKPSFRTCTARIKTDKPIIWYKVKGDYGSLVYDMSYLSGGTEPFMHLSSDSIETADRLYKKDDNIICKIRHKPWYEISVIFASDKPMKWYSAAIEALVTGPGKG